MMTPPIGGLCFVLARISGLPLMPVFRACMPYYLPLGIVLVLISSNAAWIKANMPASLGKAFVPGG